MKVLFLTHRLPYAPNRGDRIRSYHTVRHLAAHADVRIVSLVHDAAEAAQAETLQATGVRVWTARVSRRRNLARAVTSLPASTPLTHTLLHAPGAAAAIDAAVHDWRPDVVLASGSGIAPLALLPALRRIPLVVDLIDVDSQKWAAFAHAAAWPKSWVFGREARSLAAFEAEIARIARSMTVVNQRECDAMRRLSPAARVEVIPIGVDMDLLPSPNPPVSKRSVVFSGMFSYGPNIEGALWLAREVWPYVRMAHPDAQLTLCGANPARSIRQLPSTDSSIIVTGSVPDMRPYLWDAALSVAPILTARGVQTKVLEAVAASLPVVVTTAVWDGLPHEVLPACRRAGDAAQFAAEMIELLEMPPEARRAMVDRAQLSSLAWPVTVARMRRLLESAAGLTPVEPLPTPVPRTMQHA